MAAELTPVDVLSFDRWRSATVCFTSLVDAFALDALRECGATHGRGKPSFTALVVKAISLALRENLAMNRLVLDSRFRHRPVQLHEAPASRFFKRIVDLLRWVIFPETGI